MMKKQFQIILFVLMTISLLTACKEDENTIAKETSAIIGTWNVTQFNLDINIGGVSLSDFLADTLNLPSQQVTIAEALIRAEINDLFENETITFKEDNTYEVMIENELGVGVWQLNEEQTVLSISTMTDQTILLPINSLSEEVLKITINEIIALEDIFDTASIGMSFDNQLQIAGDFTLIKQN